MSGSYLFNRITTTYDREEFLKDLYSLEKSLFDVRVPPQKKIKKAFGEKDYAAFIKLCKEKKVETSDPVAVGEFVRELRRRIAIVPLVTISVAFSPTKELENVISKWIGKNLKRKIIINFKIDPALVAGATVSYGGIYKDYSINAMVDDYIKSRGGNIL